MFHEIYKIMKELMGNIKIVNNYAVGNKEKGDGIFPSPFVTTFITS
jgi:hypothetical protein